MDDEQQGTNKRRRQRRRSSGDRALGDRIRKYRTRLNLSQEVAAHRVGRSEGWLLQVENGRADPGYTDLVRLAPVLEVHIGQLIPALPSGSRGLPPALSRADVLPEPGGPAGMTARTDALDLDALELQIQQYGRQVHVDRPRHLLLCLHGHLGSLRGMLAGPHPPSATRQLQRLASETAIVAGYVCYRLHNYGDAETYLTFADTLATEAGEGPLCAMSFIARSALYSPVPHGGFGGDPPTALALLDAAESAAGRGAAPLLRTWLHARRVEDHAGCAEAGASDRSMELAEHAFRSMVTRPEGFFHNWSQARLTGYRGSAAILLGRSREAIAIVEGPLKETPATLASERSFLLIILAAAYAQQGRIDDSCALFGEALELAVRAGLTERVRRIRGTRRKYLDPWSDCQAVRELDEQIRSA